MRRLEGSRYSFNTSLNSIESFGCPKRFLSCSSCFWCVLKRNDINFKRSCGIKFWFRFGHTATETFTKLQPPPMETVFSRVHFFVGSSHLQKEESRLKIIWQWKAFIIKNQWKCRLNPGSCAFRSSLKEWSGNSWIGSTSLSSDFGQWIGDPKSAQKCFQKTFHTSRGHPEGKVPRFVELIENDFHFLERYITGEESWMFE